MVHWPTGWFCRPESRGEFKLFFFSLQSSLEEHVRHTAVYQKPQFSFSFSFLSSSGQINQNKLSWLQTHLEPTRPSNHVSEFVKCACEAFRYTHCFCRSRVPPGGSDWITNRTSFTTIYNICGVMVNAFLGTLVVFCLSSHVFFTIIVWNTSRQVSTVLQLLSPKKHDSPAERIIRGRYHRGTYKQFTGLFTIKIGSNFGNYETLISHRSEQKQLLISSRRTVDLIFWNNNFPQLQLDILPIRELVENSLSSWRFGFSSWLVLKHKPCKNLLRII